MNRKATLGVKELITTGIFTAIYFVMFFISGMTGFIPIFTVLFPIVLAVLYGIPGILFLTKVKCFGMITVMGLLMGLITFAMGQGWYVIITGGLCGLAADLLCRLGGYKSWKLMLCGYCVLSMWVIGSMLPMWILKDSFFANVAATQGAEYAAQVSGFVTSGMLLVVVITTLIGALAGGILGRGVLKKHFERAGIV